MTDAPQHIIRGTPKKRIGSRLYMFNSLGMIAVYLAVVILNFVLYVVLCVPDILVQRLTTMLNLVG